MFYNPPPGVIAFAAEWEAQLNTAVGNRMRVIGVPEGMIGIRGLPWEETGAFVRTHARGGANNNIPGRGIVGTNSGINVDLATLDPDFTDMSRVAHWSTARLKDRIDAVIAHEYTEVLANRPAGGLTPHLHAIMYAPETPLKVSDLARELLREYRRVEGCEQPR